MKYVFVRIAEGVELTTSWQLLSGDDAETFSKSRREWLESYNGGDGYVVSQHEFSSDYLDKNNVLPVGRVLTSLLALDKIDEPMVADLLAVIFEMGVNTSEDLTGTDSEYQRACRRRMMFEGP